MKLSSNQSLYVRSMGKLLRVTAIFDNDDDANRHMAQSGNNDAVVAVFGKLVLLADVYDQGLAVTPACCPYHATGGRLSLSCGGDEAKKGATQKRAENNIG
jgi:hypothetical protein